MTISNRNVTIKSIFATNANTTIPTPPIAGASYRNESVTTQEIAAGWPYKEIVDSAKFNQAMFEYTTICQQLEKYGFLPWSNLTDYPAGGLCLGTNGNVYQAKQNTGPSTTAFDPVNDTSHTYWDLFYYDTFTSNRAIVSNASGKLIASAVTATQLGYLSGVTSAIQTQINAKAADNTVVHLAGAETITGNKTFSSSPVISMNTPVMMLQSKTAVKGTTPNSTIDESVAFFDKNGTAQANKLGQIYCSYSSTGDIHIEIAAFKPQSGSTLQESIGTTYPASGSPYGTAPASAENGSIVTTLGKDRVASKGFYWLGNNMLVNWGKETADDTDVHTVTFDKSFSAAPCIFFAYNRTNDTDYSVAANTSDSLALNVSTTGFKFKNRNIGSDASVVWFAIGYRYQE